MLSSLFVASSFYFALVEQQIKPLLCGKHVGVLPCHGAWYLRIAASLEAKAFGVKKGTSVKDAKRFAASPHDKDTAPMRIAFNWISDLETVV